MAARGGNNASVRATAVVVTPAASSRKLESIYLLVVIIIAANSFCREFARAHARMEFNWKRFYALYFMFQSY